MQDPKQIPTTLEEAKGGFLRRTPGNGCIWLLLIFIIGVFAIWTLIWLWDLVF